MKINHFWKKYLSLLFLIGLLIIPAISFILITDKDRGTAKSLFDLGVAYSELGMYGDAIESFKQAIRIKPDDAKAHYNLGLVYLILNDRGSALEQYKILKDIDREMANELFNLIYR
jgi:tetratricopeptide (TPR) repeat protein